MKIIIESEKKEIKTKYARIKIDKEIINIDSVVFVHINQKEKNIYYQRFNKSAQLRFFSYKGKDVQIYEE